MRAVPLPLHRKRGQAPHGHAGCGQEGGCAGLLHSFVKTPDCDAAHGACLTGLCLRTSAFQRLFQNVQLLVQFGVGGALGADLAHGMQHRGVVAAAEELGPRGLRANVVNPGPIDTGWMTEDLRSWCVDRTPAGRLGTPQDTTDLVRFLMSDAGAWITGQLLFSNGGFRN